MTSVKSSKNDITNRAVAKIFSVESLVGLAVATFMVAGAYYALANGVSENEKNLKTLTEKFDAAVEKQNKETKELQNIVNKLTTEVAVTNNNIENMKEDVETIVELLQQRNN
jgi:septal ring factor EnvC (AmiA/AmiB activator)